MKTKVWLIILLGFFLGGSQVPNHHHIEKNLLSGNISLTLKHGVWKEWEEETIYQDITLDLVCTEGNCEPEVWGYAPKFNKEVDHQGSVTIVNTKGAWRLQVEMSIRMHPWATEKQTAKYEIELIPQKSQLIGNYWGTFKDRNLQGAVTGTVKPYFPSKIVQHIPIKPREHPRLIFRAAQLPELRQKVTQTEYGQAILARLRQALQSKVYYEGYVPNGGYHAAGYCFLSLLEDDPQAAATAWDIVATSLANPGPRLLEQSPIVAGVALAYDLCYPAWDEEKRQQLTAWLAGQVVNLTNGGSVKKGWNGNAWSNWSARARGAAALAALAIIYEPEEFFPRTEFLQEPEDIWYYFHVAERNIKRYLTIGIGDRGLGTEGDHYTTEPLVLTILPFLQAYRQVLGQDLVTNSSASWFLPHYLMRVVEQDRKLQLSAYGRHRSFMGTSLFATGLPTVPPKFLPAIWWLFDRSVGMKGDRSFGISDHMPIQAAWVLVGYPETITPQNPAAILGQVLADRQKGFYVFRNQWRDDQDFVTSIYLKRQSLRGSWSFQDAGSFRIRGLGTEWAKAGASRARRENENVVLAGKVGTGGSQPLAFDSYPDGSGVVTMTDGNWLRSFAVDYSGKSGAAGLFVVMDLFSDLAANKTWIMHTEGKVTLEGQSFTILGKKGATMKGTFIAPSAVKLSWQETPEGGKILASGGSLFYVVMTVQKEDAPAVKVDGVGLNATIQVGEQEIRFADQKIIW